VVCLSVFEEPHRGGLHPLGLSNHEKNEVEVNFIEHPVVTLYLQ